MHASVHLLTPDELADLLRTPGPRRARPLLLDFRSPSDFSKSHIKHAEHIAIPSLLLRRLQRGQASVSTAVPCLKEIGAQPVVAYDNDTSGSSSPVLTLVTKKLSEEGTHVSVLRGGFSQFSLSHADMCRRFESSSDSEVEEANLPAVQGGLHALTLGASSGSEDSEPPLSTPFSAGGRTPNQGPPSEKCRPRTLTVLAMVVPHLYLGNAAHADDWETVQRLGITHILNVTSDLPNKFEDEERVRYLRVPITDHWSQDVAVHLPKAIKFIEEARAQNGRVLVHCLAGISRSVTVTIAYLMQSRGISLNAAFDMVRAVKPNVSPNFTFLQQLQQFERSLEGVAAENNNATIPSPLSPTKA